MSKLKNRISVFPLILVLGILYLLSSDMGITRWYQLRNERHQIQADIDRLIREEKKLTIEEARKLIDQIEISLRKSSYLSE